jgi:tetratricopeptide (TPR) repeat protein
MKNKLLITLLFCSICGFAQSPQIDSMRRILFSSAHDTIKLHAYSELAYAYIDVDLDSAKVYPAEGLKKFSSSPYRLYVSDLYSALGTIYGYERDFPNSLRNFEEALKILKTSGKKSELAKGYFNIGLIYFFTAEYKKAAEYYLEALKLLESIKDKETLPTIYNGLGSIYKEMANYPEAINAFNKALKLYSENKDSVGLSSIYNNLGNIYDYQEKLADAKKYYMLSMDIKEKIGYDRGMSSTINNLGIIANKENELDKALEYFNKALSYSGPNSDALSQAISYDGIGTVYYKKKDYSKALSYFEKSLSISTDIDSKVDIVSTYSKVAMCYAARGNYKKAYDYTQLMTAIKDSILNIENTKQVNEMAVKYESEKKQLVIENLNKDNALQQEELAKKELEVKQRNTQMLFFAVALILVSVLAFFIFRGYRQKKISNDIITAQKIEVEKHRDLFEEKNKEILDSIAYAKRIQGALLAGEGLLNKNLPEHFVFYKPKDIVSGDFYWASAMDNRFYLCVADCTGHGVPGAFMSLLNISFLNEAVIEKKIDSPEKVLSHVRNQIISSLNPEGTSTESRDGMDAVLCMFDFKGMWMRFAAANNPVWLIRNNELKEFPADKMPVGMHHGEQKPFTLQTLGLRKNDMIYLFTDGYADQFGGDKGKKFKYKNLKKVLLENAERPMKEQKQVLETLLKTWQGSMEQVDDILIIGIKI